MLLFVVFGYYNMDFGIGLVDGNNVFIIYFAYGVCERVGGIDNVFGFYVKFLFCEEK